MNEDFAAPAKGLPFLSTAFVSQAAVAPLLLPLSHFFMKEVFAAPASGFPSLPTARASQLVGAG
jgi:hypothetical protein